MPSAPRPPTAPPRPAPPHPATDPRPPIHATNAWNPTGRTLKPVPGCRLYYTYLDGLAGPRTPVLLGTQQHLSYVADLEGHVPESEVREAVLRTTRLYPHLVDLGPALGERA